MLEAPPGKWIWKSFARVFNRFPRRSGSRHAPLDFRTIKQNLWFTAGYNVIGMLLAALGWLPPIFAAADQALPDLAVMGNSARLLRRA